jgi:subtilisin family serine protease
MDIPGQDQKSWQEDLIGTGTHYATLIAGRDDGTGIVGLAPEAEMHILRVLPGGSSADLIEALDYCIAHRIDVAMFGSGITEYSPLLAAKVDEAWRAGVTCVAAAGQAEPSWPAALPQVLAVGAIGQLGTFPPQSTDTGTLTGPVTPEGLFGPVPAGPAVDCCAPGVAVIGGLPPASYGPLSGNGVAAAHVTALAALILAHHPVYRTEPGSRRTTHDAASLIALIIDSCRALPLPGTGAGLPDAAVALGIAPRGTHSPLPVRYPPPGPDGRVPLEPLTAAMTAAGLLPG